ncbi:MAG: phosphonate ABC transporter ATP-binding protein, partial [Bacteroides sp.]
AVVMTTHNYTIVHNYPARIVKCENAQLNDVEQEAEQPADELI